MGQSKLICQVKSWCVPYSFITCSMQVLIYIQGGSSPYTPYMRICHSTSMVWWKIALHTGPHFKFFLTKGSLFAPKVRYKRVRFFSSKIKVSHLKMHILPTSNLKFSASPQKQGQNFSADAPYRRMVLEIPKWHTHIQKSGKSPPPFPWEFKFTVKKMFLLKNQETLS